MMSCPIPRKISVVKKPLSPLLPEFPAIVKPKAKVMSKEKLAARMAKFHRKSKFNLNTCKQNLEMKKLKAALEARKEQTVVMYPMVKTKKPRLEPSAEKQAKQFKIFPTPKK